MGLSKMEDRRKYTWRFDNIQGPWRASFRRGNPEVTGSMRNFVRRRKRFR